jgi:adenylate kinase family enzyme
MSLAISSDTLQTFKSKNLRLIFCIGFPGSGLESQIEKVSNEFKYNKICIHSSIKKETELDTDLGKSLKEYLDKGESYPKDLLINLILNKSLECGNNKTILISGFPNNLEEAQYFEEKIAPIELILKFNASKETCIHNLKEIPECKINEEEFGKKYDEILNNFNLLTEFYSPYSLIREIDCNKSIDEINSLLKQNLYPIIYSIIGKRYSGKTTLGQILKEKMGIDILDFNEFLIKNSINKKQLSKVEKEKENEIIVNKLILKLRQMRTLRILIEDFPQNKEQYIYFCNNCKKFQKIYYLDAENSTCLERLNRIPFGDPNYIDSSKLSEMLYQFEQKKPFYDFLKKSANVEEINVNNHLILTINQMMKQVQPYIAYIDFDEESNNKKEELFDKLKSKYNFCLVDIDKIIEKAKIRKLIDANKELTLEEKIELVRPIIFREECSRIILNTFPSCLSESIAFENKLCYITKYIIITSKKDLISFKPDNSMWSHYYTSNILTIINPNDITDFKLEETLDMIKDISIVYGPPQSGKSTIVKHLKEKYNFEILDFKEMIEQVKKTKIDPENPDAEPEITFADLTSYLKNYLANPKNLAGKKIIIDNILIMGGADPFLIDTYEKAKEIVDIFGKFKNLYEIFVEEKNLLNKYKAKEGISEEMTEEQKTAYEESMDKPRKLLEDIKQKSANIIQIDCNESEIKSIQKFDSKYGINLIVIKHDYELNLEQNLEIFSAKNKILYVNVPKLIYQHFYNNDTFAKKLESTYGRKPLKECPKNPEDKNESIYYKYNPIKFETNLVNQLILNYISKNSKLIEDSGNFVILTGYLNNDLLQNSEEAFNLPLLELNKTMELGQITSFIQITKKGVEENETEKPEQLIIEKPKKKIVTDPLDVDGPPGGEEEKPEEEAPPEEENNPDGVPKFKPENFSWTNYDGKPRNYVQILKRLKNWEVKVDEFNDNKDYGAEIEKIIGEHIEKFGNKENKYNGKISLIKITNKIDKANETAVEYQL